MGERAGPPQKDLALVQIPGFGLPTIELGDSDGLQSGAPVIAVGNPLGLEGSVSVGVVSGIRQLGDGYRVIQTDAAVNPGNSGGPLLAGSGKVIGIVTFKLRGTENLSFVLPLNYARGLLASTDSYTLDELRSKLGKVPDVFQAARYASRWKSLASGTVKILRVDGDNVYVETVLPEAVKQAGGFTLAELKKSGTKYVGTTKSAWPCQWGDGVWIKVQWHLCPNEAPIEFTVFTPSRIEGRTQQHPPDDKLRCRSCSHSEAPVPASFVWIPE